MSFANRREPRLRAQVPVIVTQGKKTFTATTEDVSYHGLYIALDERPPLRQLVRIEVQLRGGTETFQTHATVVRHADDYGRVGIGVEFFGRTESAAWDQFVQETQRNPPQIVEQRAAPRPPPQPPGMPGTDPNRAAPQVPGPPGTDPNRMAPPIPPPPGSPQPGRVSVPPPLPPRKPAAPPPPPGFAPPGFAMPPHGEPEIKLGPAPEGGPSALAPPPAPSGAPPGGVERRRHPRIPLPVDIRVRTSRSMHAATGIDVSLGGISLCAPDLALNIGEQVILNIAQPSTNFTFRLDAVVRRTLPSPYPGTFAFGFEFLPLDGTRQTLLAEFLESAVAAVAARRGGSP